MVEWEDLRLEWPSEGEEVEVKEREGCKVMLLSDGGFDLTGRCVERLMRRSLGEDLRKEWWWIDVGRLRGLR